MKKNRFSLCLTTVCLMTISCNNEIDPSGNTSPLETENEAILHIHLTTRSGYPADHLPGENDIRSLAFHIFNADNTRDEKTPYIYIKEEKDVVFIPVTPGEKTVLVTVNNSSATVQQSSLSDLLRTIFVRPIDNPLGSPQISGNIHNTWTGIPMNGRESSVLVKPGEVKKVFIEAERMLSRINPPTDYGTLVALSEKEKERLEKETGKSFGDDLTFRLEAHIVINGGRQHILFPDYGVENEFERWTKWIRLPSYVASEYDEKGQLVSAYSGSTFLENKEPVYVYENSPRLKSELEPESSDKLYDTSMIYAFIIRGELKDDAGTSAVRYWRINIAKNSYHEGQKVAPYQILRNAIYKVNILHVRTAGYETPEEAEKELPYIPGDGESAMVTEVELNRWRVFNSGADL